jgi:D-serine deaminase-like pyridoxal phosphate-dependent protein
MESAYRIADTSQIVTPALVVFRELVVANLDAMVRIARDPFRLRPHCKTHKMPAVIKLALQRGIVKHKAATFAEAEMLAEAGASEVFLAYNIVGANLKRTVRFVEKFPNVAFSVTADADGPIQQLGAAMAEAGKSVDVLLDVDTGQHRTGVACGSVAQQLYQLLAETPGVAPSGIHLYDGQNHQTDLDERRRAVLAAWNEVADFRDRLEDSGLSVPRIVAGGTGSFPVFAEVEDPALELSPGTCIFQDVGYSEMFPDLPFQVAALLLTRVISRPTPNRLTFDLGYKAVASDPPADRRVVFPDLPDAKIVLQNEEHLVVETTEAGRYRPGDELFAIPRHICPTSALHREVQVVSNGEVVDAWTVAARDRVLTV